MTGSAYSRNDPSISVATVDVLDAFACRHGGSGFSGGSHKIGAMLPAPSVTVPSLAAVVPSSSPRSPASPIGWVCQPYWSAVVLLVDGLGAAALSARAGHARTLAPAMGRADVIHTVFPTTTAAALGSLTTGASPGEHGLVGYTILDPANDRIEERAHRLGS